MSTTHTTNGATYDATTDPMPTAQCHSCGHVWIVLTVEGGRRPRRWWECPSGCNAGD